MQGRVVLVTGAARGIGKEVARQLADLGASGELRRDGQLLPW